MTHIECNKRAVHFWCTRSVIMVSTIRWRHHVTIASLCIGAWILVLGSQPALAGCQSDSDCAEQSTFCNPLYCDEHSGACLTGAEPCAGACLDDEKRCVECARTEDCIYGLVCHANEHKCVPCVRDEECLVTDWCHGEHQICDRTHHRCRDPTDLPCPDAERCISAFRQCFPCLRDADCGLSDFCESPQTRCNTATGQCIVGPSRCEEEGLFCDATNERCVSCRSDADCTNIASRPYCSPPIACSDKGECVEDTNHSTPCLDSETCDERRKRCIKSESPPSNAVPNSNGNTGSVNNKHVGTTCYTPEDCRPYGLVCHIVSPSNGKIRECRPCRTHAQCADGNPYNGDEICDMETGRCLPPTESDESYAAAHNQDSTSKTTTTASSTRGSIGHTTTTTADTTQRIRQTVSASESYLALGLVIGFLSLLIIGGLIYYCVVIRRQRSRRGRTRR